MKLAPPSVHTLEKIPDTFSALGAIALRFAGRGRRDSWDCWGCRDSRRRRDCWSSLVRTENWNWSISLIWCIWSVWLAGTTTGLS